MQVIAPQDWWRVTRIGDDVTLIDEPHIQPFYRCNIWHVRGRDRDLLFDTGLGAVSLRRHVARRAVLTATLAFVGAIGSTIWMAILAKPLHDPTTAYLATGAHSMGLLVGVALGVLAGAAPGWTTARERPSW